MRECADRAGAGAAQDTAGAPTELFPEQEVDSRPQPVTLVLEASGAAFVSSTLVSDTMSPWLGDPATSSRCEYPQESFDLQNSEMCLNCHSSPIALPSAPALRASFVWKEQLRFAERPQPSCHSFAAAPGSATSRLIDAMALRETAADAPHTSHHATEHGNAVLPSHT